jgi:hypothetical protein
MAVQVACDSRARPLPTDPMTLPSRHADRAAAERAVALALPSIEHALQDPAVSGLGVLHLVVMDPAIGPADASFDAAVL